MLFAADIKTEHGGARHQNSMGNAVYTDQLMADIRLLPRGPARLLLLGSVLRLSSDSSLYEMAADALPKPRSCLQ
ncbi:hypothetical protein OESDEN_07889 [Oesophagostomum dentatum]|uniref:Uncharacterized protein n=1 Tax=Oesophagostomum dentatum TaxID=61180 RepID=A0A0B1T3V3_OESDE|nr:hypothetical protein OESDEN_07889 [Oesophagostomum dentatum]